MFGLGIWELVVILGIVVLLFGAKRLPMIGEGLGQMITNFRKSTKADELEHQTETKVIDPREENKEAN
ncbi:twin-arginine translocase TatA/TatE family subunit [Deltaproteobacteria bacterium TL4]